MDGFFLRTVVVLQCKHLRRLVHQLLLSSLPLSSLVPPVNQTFIVLAVPSLLTSVPLQHLFTQSLSRSITPFCHPSSCPEIWQEDTLPVSVQVYGWIGEVQSSWEVAGLIPDVSTSALREH